MTEEIKPKKFVGLHSHSRSTFDSMGSPKEHINFALKNGMDALALTDHGHLTGMAEQYSHGKELKKKGVNFKTLYGVESYFLPSLSNWQTLYDAQKEEKRKAKENKKKAEDVSHSFSETKNDLEEISENKKEIADEDSAGGTIIENEEENKGKSKFKNPLYQRNHLVLLPKNNEGLKALFRIVSASAADGFYKFPRIDYNTLRKNCNGNIIASTACLFGFLSKIILDEQVGDDWKIWEPNNDNFELIQDKMKKEIETFQDILGKENYYLELQFNSFGAQHLINKHLIEASKRTGAQLITTVDAHYADPSHWREREIYRLIGWQQKNKDGIDASAIPKSIDELKCELYPKNANQVWDSYKKYSSKYDFYDDALVCESIEKTHEIAHQQIGEVEPDTSVKLPAIRKLISGEKLDSTYKNMSNENLIAFKELKELAVKGLVFRKKDKEQVYIDRLLYELDIIKHLKLSKYFLTYQKIMEIVSEKLLTGAGRGCFLPGSRVKMADKLMAPIETIQVGEKVIDAYGIVEEVENVLRYDVDEEVIELEFEDGKIIRCTKDHKILTTNRGWVEAQHLTEDDNIKEV